MAFLSQRSRYNKVSLYNTSIILKWNTQNPQNLISMPYVDIEETFKNPWSWDRQEKMNAIGLVIIYCW